MASSLNNDPTASTATLHSASMYASSTYRPTRISGSTTPQGTTAADATTRMSETTSLIEKELEQPSYQSTAPVPRHRPLSLIGDFPLQENPQRVVCPYCGEHIVTSTKPVVGKYVPEAPWSGFAHDDRYACRMTWLSSAGLCIFGCFCGCCLIPFFSKTMRDVEHSCPRCSNRLGIFRRMD